VDNTKTKTISEEAKRLFGQKCTVERLSEPGLVYRTKAQYRRGAVSKTKPEIASRITTGPGIKPVVQPSLAKKKGSHCQADIHSLSRWKRHSFNPERSSGMI
jgi:hypothetical protein